MTASFNSKAYWQRTPPPSSPAYTPVMRARLAAQRHRPPLRNIATLLIAAVAFGLAGWAFTVNL